RGWDRFSPESSLVDHTCAPWTTTVAETAPAPSGVPWRRSSCATSRRIRRASRDRASTRRASTRVARIAARTLTVRRAVARKCSRTRRRRRLPPTPPTPPTMSRVCPRWRITVSGATTIWPPTSAGFERCAPSTRGRDPGRDERRRPAHCVAWTPAPRASSGRSACERSTN
ncbi:hypothetical protein PENTCL1PPCAC_18503, partial [Pristionchus entomophagus]